MTSVPSGERIHIGFFGLANAGKSSLVNAFTGQDLSLVSAVKGTTTDPVKKAMELLPLGPVVIVDTPGLDDDSALGPERVARARKVMGEIHVAVVVRDGAADSASPVLEALLRDLEARSIPFVEVFTKADLVSDRIPGRFYASALTGENIKALKELVAARAAASRREERRLVGDLLAPGDMVVLVTPIDAAAPKGRLILPQQQVLRDVLDAHATAFVCQPEELSSVPKRPRLVITDSQVFDKVAAAIPKDWPLTSFSILFARYKGDLELLSTGAKALETLQDGDDVLVSEGCTHHRQCGDIGTEKLPAWISKFSGAKLNFHFTSGGEFPLDLTRYKLIVHCGGCMLNDAAMKTRLDAARRAGVPIVNYGIAIARMKGLTVDGLLV